MEFITGEAQSILSPEATTTLLVPSDFVPAIMWGAVADLLDMASEARDSERAQYARQRFEQYAEMLTGGGYPFVMSARGGDGGMGGGPQLLFVDAVESLDRYMTGWRTVAQNPTIVGTSGQNLVAFPSSSVSELALFMVGNAVLPNADGDFLQVGREVTDAVLDYAQHIASFKMGWAEFSYTMPLFKNVVSVAGERNSHIRAMGEYRDLLHGKSQRESETVPRESNLSTVEEA